MNDLIQALATVKANVSDFVSWLKAAVGPLVIAGAAGGATKAMALRNGFGESVISIVVGFMCATYLTDAIHRRIPEVGDRESIAFLIGMGGIAIVGFVLDLIRQYRAVKTGKGGA